VAAKNLGKPNLGQSHHEHLHHNIAVINGHLSRDLIAARSVKPMRDHMTMSHNVAYSEIVMMSVQAADERCSATPIETVPSASRGIEHPVGLECGEAGSVSGRETLAIRSAASARPARRADQGEVE